MSLSPPTSPLSNNNNNNNYKNSTPGGGQTMAGTPAHSPASGVGATTMMEAWELPSTRGVMLCPLGRQDSEDLDHLIVAADTGLLQLTCLQFDLEWLWCDLLDFWSSNLLSPFEDTSLNGAQ